MRKTKTQSYDDYRALIYYRQSVISRWLGVNSCTTPCLRYRVPNVTNIEITKRNERAKYRGLQICRRNWLCPVCANKIARDRRRQMERAIGAMATRGYALVFITYTVQHVMGEGFVVVRDRVRDAHLTLHSGKGWLKIEREYDWGGSIKTVECTYSESGWHFHLHEIGFVGDDKSIPSLEQQLRDRWLYALKTVGGWARDDIGLVAKPADKSLRDYVVKWGICPELVAGSSKGARLGGVLPFQLPDYLLNQERSEDWARGLFREYAKGIHGVKQLWASPSVRPYMKAPEAAPEQGDQAAQVLASLTVDEWREIRRRGQRANLLRAAEQGELTEFLTRVKL